MQRRLLTLVPLWGLSAVTPEDGRHLGSALLRAVHLEDFQNIIDITCIPLSSLLILKHPHKTVCKRMTGKATTFIKDRDHGSPELALCFVGERKQWNSVYSTLFLSFPEFF